MKLKNIILSIMLAYTTLGATHADESAHENHGQFTGEYESIFFSENSLEDLSFEYKVYDPRLKKEVLSFFGNSEYPHAAFFRVSKSNINPDVVFLSDPRSAFADTQSEVAKAAPTGFVVIDSSMIFLAEDGYTIVDPSVASYAIMPNVLVKVIESLTHISVVGMRECTNKGFTSNYSGYKCSSNREIHRDFKKFLNTHLVSCVNAGLGAAGKPKAQGVHVIHGGVRCDGNHSKRSLHCAFRAIDIRSIISTQSNGNKLTVDYSTARKSKNSWERTFYHNFGACWSKKNIARDKNCRDRRGSNGQAGIIRWEDGKHGRHMHVSMPYCSTSTKKHMMK